MNGTALRCDKRSMALTSALTDGARGSGVSIVALIPASQR